MKNVILLIGDGMGPQQLGFFLTFAREASASPYRGRPSGIEKMMKKGVVALSLTHPRGALVVDSAASATQLAIGRYSRSEMIGLDERGESAVSVLEYAKQTGRATGLVSDTRLTHATPASFAAHQAHRRMENEIALDMIRIGPDVMLGGGMRNWLGRGKRSFLKCPFPLRSIRKDEFSPLRLARKSDYRIVCSRTQLNAIRKGKVLGLFSPSGMADGVSYSLRKNDPKREEPSLAEMTRKALEILARNPRGFFLMVEGGQIDWAGHANDAGRLLHEMLKFDEAIEVVYQWARERNDTLVILTADHETGGMGFSYSNYGAPGATRLPGSFFRSRKFKPNYNFVDPEILNRLFAQKMSYNGIFDRFDEQPASRRTPRKLASLVREYLGFSISVARARNILRRDGRGFPRIRDFREFYVSRSRARSALLARALARKQGIVWATGTHTATPVPFITLGPETWSRKFSGLLHHADAGRLMRAALRGKIK